MMASAELLDSIQDIILSIMVFNCRLWKFHRNL